MEPGFNNPGKGLKTVEGKRSIMVSDLLGLDPKSPRIGSNAKLYLLRQVFSQTRKKLSLK